MALPVRAYVAGEGGSRIIDLDRRSANFASSEPRRRALENNRSTVPSIFVSHYNEDSRIAEHIASYTRNIGIDVFLDVDDPNLPEKDDVEMVDYIKGVINHCQGLLVVTSRRTVKSWWVPYEIGVADQRDLVLAAYTLGDVVLPSYLRKWPKLSNREKLKYWCEALKNRHGRSSIAFYEALGRKHPSIYEHRDIVIHYVP